MCWTAEEFMSQQPGPAPWAGSAQERFEHELRSMSDGRVRRHEGVVHLFMCPSPGYRGSTLMLVAPGHKSWFERTPDGDEVMQLGREALAAVTQPGEETAMVTTSDRTTDEVVSRVYRGPQARRWFFNAANTVDLVEEVRPV